jgi:hypothetical protein
MINDPLVRILLRLEGLGLALLCVWLFRSVHASWWLFAALILAPDLAMLAYLRGPRLGAIVYNAAHTWLAPILLFAVGWWGGINALLPVAFIWGAHIGFDRALGYGLKLPAGFKDTHLGRIGPAA